MTEILTESFCERCGTRYTFESDAPKQRRMGGIRVLGRGLKNFVLSDDSSLDEAMAAARSDEEREATAQQLDAFHRTFNFCMSCRQYTCGNCWNGVEARCLSCAPMAEAEIVAAAPFAMPMAPAPGEVDLDRLMRVTAPPAEAAWPPATGAEPELVGQSEILVRADAPAEAMEPAAVMDAEALVTAEALEPPEVEAPEELEPEAPEAPAPLDWWVTQAVRAEPEQALPEEPVAAEMAEAEEPVAAEVELVAADAEPALRGLEPGASLDDAIAAYEAAAIAAYEAAQAEAAEVEVEAPVPEVAEAQPEPAEAEAAPGAGPGFDIVAQPTWPSAPGAFESEAMPVEAAEAVVAEPEPAAPAAPEPEPEPVAAAPAPEPEGEPIAAATPAPPQPEPEVPAPAPIFPPAAPAAPAGPPSGAPQWPTGPRWPTGIPARQEVPPAPPPGPVADPLAAIMARQATEAMWAASSRDVVQPPLVARPAPIAGVQPCVNCGISLSANARFCRRCGTSQVG